MTVASRKRSARPSKPIYFAVERVCVIDPKTGEMSEPVGALVPLTTWDRDAMRRRKYHVGSQIRAELKKPRNPKFNALVHAFGGILVDAFAECAGMDAHDALKHMQGRSGVACQTVTYQLPGVGTLTRMEPRSLAFDSLDEGEFAQVFRAICNFVTTLPEWANVDPLARDEMLAMMEDTVQ